MPAHNRLALNNTVTFTVPAAGYSNYQFFVNNNSAQNSSANTYTSSSLKNGDEVYVVATNPSASFCPETSNKLVFKSFQSSGGGNLNPGMDFSACKGSSTTFTLSAVGTNVASYRWQSSGDGSNFTDIAGTANTPTYKATFNVAPSTTYYRVAFTSKSGACEDYSAVRKVTVQDNANIKNFSLNGQKVNSVAICKNGTAIFSATYVIDSNTDKLKSAPSPTGSYADVAITPSNGPGTVTYVIPQNAVGTYYYRYVRTNAGSLCESSIDFSIEVYDPPTATNISATSDDGQVADATNPSISFCAGNGINKVVFTSSATTAQYKQWQEKPNGVATYSNIAGATDPTLVVTGAKNMNTDYRLLVSNVPIGNANVTCAVSSNVITLIGKQLPAKPILSLAPIVSGNPVQSTATICIGQNFNFYSTGYASTDAGYYVEEAPASTTIVPTYANNIPYKVSYTPTVTSTSPYTVLTYSLNVFNGTCSNGSEPVYVQVDQKANAGTISADNATICNGLPTTLRVNGAVGTSYIFKSANTAIGPFTPIASSTEPSLVVNPTAKTYYVVQVFNGSCGSVQSVAPFALEVSQPSVAGTIVADKNPNCAGYATTLQLKGFKGDIGWYESNDGINFKPHDFGQYPPSPGVVVDKLVVNELISTTYIAIVTEGACTAATSAPYVVSRLQRSDPGVIKASNTIPCKLKPVTLYTEGSFGPLYWEFSEDMFNWKPIVTPTSSTSITVQLPNKDAVYYRVIVKTGGICRDSISKVFELMPGSGAYADKVIAAKDTICQGQKATLTAIGNTGTIQWQFSDELGNWFNIPGASSSTYISSDLFSTTFFRTVVTNGACRDTSNEKPIVVTEAPIAGKLQSANGKYTTCNGAPYTLYLTNYSGNKVQWQISSDNFSFNTFVAQSSPTLTISPTATAYYRAILSTPGCSDTSASRLVTIRPAVLAGFVSASKKHCLGTTTTLIVAGSNGTLQWQISSDNVNFTDIAGANSTSIKVSPTLDTYYRIKSSIADCDTKFSNSVKLTVVEGSYAGAARALKETVCANSSTTLQLYQSPIGDIQWQESLDNKNFTDIPNAVKPDFTVVLGTSKFFRAYVGNGVCAADTSNSIFINVIPAAIAGPITASASELCIENGGVILNASAAVGSFQWQSSFDGNNYKNIPGAFAGNYQTGGIVKTTYYRLVAYNQSCTDTSAVLKVTINTPAVAGNITSDKKEVCPGDIAKLTVINYEGSIQWQSSLDNLNFTDIAFESGTSISVNPNFDTYYRVKISKNACGSVFSKSVLVKTLQIARAGQIYDSKLVRANVSTKLYSFGASGDLQWQSSADGLTFKDVDDAYDSTLYVSVVKATYYRLIASKGICRDTSNVVKLTVDFDLLGLTPNPSSGDLKLTFTYNLNSSKDPVIMEVNIYDDLGQVVGSSRFTAVDGVNTYQMDVSYLTAGVHVLTVGNKDFQLRRKFVKL